MNREELNRIRRMGGVAQDFTAPTQEELHEAGGLGQYSSTGATTSSPDNHVHPDEKEMADAVAGREEVEDEKDFETDDEFKKGDRVRCHDEECVVVVADASADMVVVAPVGSETDVDSFKMVQAGELQKLEDDSEDSDEEVDADPEAEEDGEVEMEIDVDESMHYHTDDNYETHVDHEDQPMNVTAPYPTVWDKDDEEEEEDYEMANDTEKVHVPADVLTDLKSVITDCEKEAEKAEKRDNDERKWYYADTAKALQIVHDYLSMKTVEGFKRAQLMSHRMANVSRHLMPDHVWKFIIDGGTKRSLKDYMNDVKDMKYPVEGPRNTLDDNN